MSDHPTLLRQVTAAAVAVALVLAVGKSVVWFFTDSVALLSSMFDSLLDCLASVVNLLAVRHALTPADAEHRFGHGKVEPLAALVQVGLISGSAVLLVFEATHRLFSPQPLVHVEAAVAVMVVSMAATAVLVVWQRRVARQTGSLAVGADSLHYVTDLLTNGAVLAALLCSAFLGWSWADPVFALVVVAVMGVGIAGIFRGAWNNLMDRELPDDERDRIAAMVLAHPDARALHDLRTRAVGSQIFMQFHLELDGALSLHKAHEISDAIEADLLRRFPGAQIIIHQDPAGITEPRPGFAAS